MIGNAVESFDRQSNLIDPTSQELILQLLQNLVAWTRQLQVPTPSLVGG
jgi:hypothetical protein